MTGLFHREKKQEYFLEKISEKKVSVFWQCTITFIPFFALFIRIWVFARIEKLGKGTLYTAIILGSSGGIIWLLYSVYGIKGDAIWLLFFASLISTQVIMLFFLIR